MNCQFIKLKGNKKEINMQEKMMKERDENAIELKTKIEIKINIKNEIIKINI